MSYIYILGGSNIQGSKSETEYFRSYSLDPAFFGIKTSGNWIPCSLSWSGSKETVNILMTMVSEFLGNHLPPSNSAHGCDFLFYVYI